MSPLGRRFCKCMKSNFRSQAENTPSMWASRWNDHRPSGRTSYIFGSVFSMVSLGTLAPFLYILHQLLELLRRYPLLFHRRYDGIYWASTWAFQVGYLQATSWHHHFLGAQTPDVRAATFARLHASHG